MDTLTNKKTHSYDYLSRYSGVNNYYDTLMERYISGISKNMLLNLPWVAHKVTHTDTLDSLALHYYNNPSFWWVIAYFNSIQDPFLKLENSFEILKIPQLTSIEFGDLRK